jgi:hypothetical protein
MVPMIAITIKQISPAHIRSSSLLCGDRPGACHGFIKPSRIGQDARFSLFHPRSPVT